MAVECSHDTIDAQIEIGPARSTIRFSRGMRYPDDPPNTPLRRISIYNLNCTACGRALTKRDVGERFGAGGDLYHPRFDVEYAEEWR